MPFWGRVDIAPHMGGGEIRISSLMRIILKLAYCQNYHIESRQILHIDKCHQMLFVSGPNAYNKSKMADGRHFEKSKKSPYISNSWTDRHEIMNGDAY